MFFTTLAVLLGGPLLWVMWGILAMWKEIPNDPIV
jgi:hypothetical protein